MSVLALKCVFCSVTPQHPSSSASPGQLPIRDVLANRGQRLSCSIGLLALRSPLPFSNRNLSNSCLVSKSWPANGSRAIVMLSWASIEASEPGIDARVSLREDPRMGIPINMSCK
jgi:hypothetical protein